ncbi:DMT family transporter [Pengzhenrongella frigida]|uniref:Multidrug efflux SMR transporter n=1 Tax=Pengzhenrongella frigida TaxID=1259133 RepID=A0A4Q5MVI9_9MICO|nr:multidrug efflux SMR transporter [Cellulomonas sp. HLT2-17]RYV49568.1 multidrug efflux SMR transporter [Cellulomonas sp. HLT2-17]
MARALVIIAGLFETGFALSLKASDGFSRPVPSALFVVFAAASFTLLSLALRTLPVGSAYAVWTGIGAVGTAVAGMLFFGESTEVLKLVSIVLIVAGVVGLQLTSTAH